MRVAMVTGPGKTDVLEVPDPSPGPADVLVKMKACGICGSDSLYIAMGGLPPHTGRMPLGHEPAGEVVALNVDGVGGLACPIVTRAAGGERGDAHAGELQGS